MAVTDIGAALLRTIDPETAHGLAIRAAAARPAKRSVFPAGKANDSGRSSRMLARTSASRVSSTTGRAPEATATTLTRY
jgi:hypothetical protein